MKVSIPMLRLISALLLVLLLGAYAAATTTQPRTVTLPIDTVDTAIMESFPIQLQVRFAGILPDGCTSMGEITSERDNAARTITITALGNHSGAEACTMIAQMFEETIIFQGPFEPGEWTIMVNNVETTVTL
ncbi:MAG: hypothetical protein HC822_01385 [Oscillochloris sp.]|nr:hypothetical protein [Oscillochloris sp.]